MESCSNSTRGAAQPVEHLDEEDGHDEILGSRLEIELNRSIEKMREEEKALPGSHRRSGDFVDSYNQGSVSSSSQHDIDSSSPSHNFTDELLEDIEMPNMSISQWENSDLVSVSSVSPISPVKAHGSSKIEISSSSSFVAAENKRTVQEEVSAKHMTVQTISREMDVYEKLAFLSAPSTVCVKTLVSIDEINTDNRICKRKSYICDASWKESSELELGDEAANTTSNISSPDIQMTLGTGFELLDIENMNDSLLISSILEKSNKVKKPDIFTFSPSQTLEKECDPMKVKTAAEGDESFSSGFLSDACGIVAELEMRAASMTSPDRRKTLGPLDIDAVNDNLLNSISLVNSPAQKEHLQGAFTSSLPSVMEDLGNKIEITSDVIVKPNDCTFDGLVKALKNAMENECVLSLKTKKISKVTNNLEDTLDNEKLSKGMNLTFDHQNIRPILNSTFEKQLEDPASIPFDRKDANTTFVQNVQCANRTFECENSEDTKPCKFMNLTFEKNDQPATCVNDNLENDDKEKDKLNVTFERGEYKIASMNETVNLMDAEADILKIILDATPHKVSKTAPDAASTPKSSNTPSNPAAKRMITKDPTQTFLRRISLGMRRDTASKRCEDESQRSSQALNTQPVIPGLKMGSIDQQAVANQLRRLHSGSSSTRSGPVRALPGLSIAGAHKPQDSANAPDGLEDVGGGSENHAGVNDACDFTRRERPAPASFGSVSSIESERPGTPDIGIITGIGMSTPDVFRCEGPSNGPRITSTPAMRGAAFSCVVGIEGPAPTPISAPSSRLRSNSVVSTASLPEGQHGGTPSWQGFSQDSSKDSKMTAKFPDQSTSSIPKQFPLSDIESQENLDSHKSSGQDKKPKRPVDTIFNRIVCSQDQEGANFDTSIHDLSNKETTNMLPATSDNAESHIQCSNFGGNFKLTAAELTVGANTNGTRMELKAIIFTNDHHQVNDAAIAGTSEVPIESSFGKKLVVDIDAIESQALQDFDTEYREKEDKKRESYRSNNKIQMALKTRTNTTKHHKSATKRGVISDISKETNEYNNVIEEKPSVAYGMSSPRVMQDKTKFERNKSRSPQVMKNTVSVVNAQDALDKKKEYSSLKSEKVKSFSISRKRNVTGSRSLRSNNALNKDDKENKIKSIESLRQSVSQVKAGAHATQGRKVPSLRPILGHSNIAGKRSLATRPSVQKNIPIKSNPKHLKVESLKIPRAVEAKKLKSPSQEPPKSSPTLSASKATTVSKGLWTSSAVLTKAVPRSKILTGIKFPVDVNHSSPPSSCSTLKPKNQSYSASNSHARSKLPRNTNTNSTAPRKLSMLKVQKKCVL